MRPTLAVAVALLLAAPADAQLGSLRDRARQAVQQATEDRAPAAQTPAPAESPAARPASGPAPAVNAYGLYRLPFDETRGVFYNNEGLFAVFPVSGGEYALVVLAPSGTEVARQQLVLEPIQDVQDRPLPAFGLLGTRGQLAYSRDPAPGAYTLAVLLDGEPIAAIETTVTNESSDDPFNPVTTWRADGPWADLGVVRVLQDDDARLEVSYWLDPAEVGADGTDVAAVLYRDGQRLTPADHDGEPVYASFGSRQLRTDKFEVGEGIHAHHMTRAEMTDGTYRIEVVTERGRTLRRFSFRVEGGQFAPHERSALDYQPRADFLSPRAVGRVRGRSAYVQVDQVWMTAE